MNPFEWPEVRWFGKSWGSALCYDSPAAPTPVGENCEWCDEEIAEADNGFILSNGVPMHKNCFLRSIIGSAAHVFGMCSCYVPGSKCNDPEGLTRRAAADLAVSAYREKNFGNEPPAKQ